MKVIEIIKLKPRSCSRYMGLLRRYAHYSDLDVRVVISTGGTDLDRWTSGEISSIGFFHGRSQAPDKSREFKTCHNEARDPHVAIMPERDSSSG